MSKLTRATVPMCRTEECHEPMKYNDDGGFYVCQVCGRREYTPLWGYHAPDVEGVVASMREEAALLYEIGKQGKAMLLEHYADRLEKSHE